MNYTDKMIIYICKYLNSLRLHKKHIFANINRKINDFKNQVLHSKKNHLDKMLYSHRSSLVCTITNQIRFLIRLFSVHFVSFREQNPQNQSYHIHLLDQKRNASTE